MSTWTLDKAHSEIRFKAKHLMITTVTGQFTDYDATVGASGDDFSAAAISFTAKTASVSTGMPQRDDHLRSDDFFNSETYPDLTFTAGGMTKTGDNTYSVTGDMTIRDVTKPVTLAVELAGVVRDPWGQTKAGLTFSGRLNRKDFGLTFHVMNEAGDLLVSDEIKLEGDVQLLKA